MLKGQTGVQTRPDGPGLECDEIGSSASEPCSEVERWPSPHGLCDGGQCNVVFQLDVARSIRQRNDISLPEDFVGRKLSAYEQVPSLLFKVVAVLRECVHLSSEMRKTSQARKCNAELGLFRMFVNNVGYTFRLGRRSGP